MITLTYRCGHSAALEERGLPDHAQCPICGTSGITRVKAPAPMFHGVGLGGPCAVEEKPDADQR